MKFFNVACGLIEDNKGRVLLIKRCKPPFVSLWALPGGKIEPGEHISLAATREILEETGLKCEFDSLWATASEIIKTCPADKALASTKNKTACGEQSTTFIFVCKLKGDFSGHLKSPEGQELKWFSREEIKKCASEIVGSDIMFLEGGHFEIDCTESNGKYTWQKL